MENKYQVIAICINCGKCKGCGEECRNCNEYNVDTNKTIKYAGALKDAVKCWNNANCDEHNVPCKPAIRKFAEKIMQLQEKIDKLESGIRSHKEIKQNPDKCDPDECDIDLWNLI